MPFAYNGGMIGLHPVRGGSIPSKGTLKKPQGPRLLVIILSPC